MAWAFLACGIALGSWWAYYELGWGGFWFWDPVENASFMPWLVGTALIHSLAVTDKRGLFKSWTLLLAVTRVLAESAGHLPGALGRAGVGAFVRGRSEPRRLHPGVPGRHDRRRTGAVRLARAADEIGRRLRFHLARVVPAVQQHPADDRRGGGVRRHAGAADRRHAATWARCRSGRRTSIRASWCRWCRCWRWWRSACTRAGGAAAWARRAGRCWWRSAWRWCWGWRWCFGVYAHPLAADADRRDARAVDHPVVADRSDRSAAAAPEPAGERGRHVDRAHRLGRVRARHHLRAVQHHRARHRAQARRSRRSWATTVSVSRACRTSTVPTTRASAARSASPATAGR